MHYIWDDEYVNLETRLYEIGRNLSELHTLQQTTTI